MALQTPGKEKKERKKVPYLWVTVPVLYVRHERESLPRHAIAPRPQARGLLNALRTVHGQRVELHGLGSAERRRAARPFAQERVLYLLGGLPRLRRRLRCRRGRRGRCARRG